MALSCTLEGNVYTYTVSNLYDVITLTPSNRSSRFGAVYTSKPTIKRNKSGSANTRYITLCYLVGNEAQPAHYYQVAYSATFTKTGTTATVAEINASSRPVLSSIAAKVANYASPITRGTLSVDIFDSSSLSDDAWFDFANFTDRITYSMSGWTPSAPTINYELSQNAIGDPDPSIFGYVVGYAKAKWTASGNPGNWSPVIPYGSLSLSANGASNTSAVGTGNRSAMLDFKLVSATSVTGTAKLTNKIGGSATSTKSVTVQSYSKPVARSLAIGRVTDGGEANHASMSIGWAVNILNKQSTASADIQTGAITVDWECEDLGNEGVTFSSGTFDIISNGESMTATDGTATSTLIDTSVNNNDIYDPDHSYRFTAYITDRIGQNSLTITAVLASEFYLICAREGGRGIGFGMVPPDDEMHVNMPATFYKDFTVVGMAGMIQMFAGSTAPTGWLMCDGSAVSRTDYATLFSVIGTTYGTGDGSTTFNLPDLRGRMPLGSSSSHSLASTGGSEYIQAHTHSNTIKAKTPKFTHSISSSNSNVNLLGGGSEQSYGKAGSGGSTYPYKRLSIADHAATDCTMSGSVGAVSGATTGNEGNMPPFLTINYIIATGNIA